MTDREELARIIDENYEIDIDSPAIGTDLVCADAILTAGYRKPRTITTVEEVAALPEGTVIRSQTHGYVFELATTIRNKAYGYSFAEETGSFIDDSYLPATVLYVPEEQS